MPPIDMGNHIHPLGSPHALAACRDCGSLQQLPASSAFDAVDCTVCDSPIERTRWRDINASLCFALAALVLLVPANLLMFMTSAIAGVSRESVIASSVTSMMRRGFPELALAIGLLVIVLPILQLGLLSWVLWCVSRALRGSRRPRALGRAFRWANALQPWAMADVFLLGFLIAYARLQATIWVEMGTGAMCFVAATLCAMFAQAALDKRAVWRAIGADAMPATSPSDAAPLASPASFDSAASAASAASPTATTAATAMIACDGCELLVSAVHEGGACPRCGARLHARKPGALARTAALVIAAVVLYVPANLYPIATLPIGFESVKYTVIEGVLDLVQAKLFGLAMVVLLASFAIPMLKLVGLGWCITSVLLRSNRHLAAKTKLYVLIEQIGRWSMVDPFVIACFVPVTQYNVLIHGSAEPAAPVFTAVVLLTTWAARSFDPRLMWDAAALPTPKNPP